MTTLAPAAVDLGSVVSAADAQLSALVQQATADPVATPQTPQEAVPVLTPSATDVPVAAPFETVQPVTAPPADDSVYTLDLRTLTPEQRRDFQDAVAKEGDPAKVASRYWEFNRRLGKNGDAATAVPAEPEPIQAQEQIAAPPQEVIAAEVRERLFTDPEVSQWRSVYADNKATLGDLLKIDPALPKPDFEAAVNATYRHMSFEIARLSRNLGESYIKENPDLELGIRQNLTDLKATRMEIDRVRMQNERLDERFASKVQTFEQSVAHVKRQEYEAREASTRVERDIEAYAERFDRAWPGQITAVAKSNQIGDEIAPGFNRMAKYEVLGMINRSEIIDEANLPQILDKLAKQYLEEIDRGHRYVSRVHALRANAVAEAPIIVPPNGVVSQDTNTRPMSRQEVDSHHDALLQRTLGEMQLR